MYVCAFFIEQKIIFYHENFPIYSDPLCFNANSGHCTITVSTKYHINLADIDKLLTRQILSTNTILVQGRINLKRLNNHVANTTGTQVPGPLTNKSFG